MTRNAPDRPEADAPRLITGVEDLIAQGLASPRDRETLHSVVARYAVAIPGVVARRIDGDDPHDPIALQLVPSADELEAAPDELADPIGDAAHSPLAGFVHRYPDRVLLKLTDVCPVYCRFCFRRESVGGGEPPLSEREIEAAVAYIAAHEEIFEVILTGGDPLMLSPRRLRAVTERLAAIAHVKVLRAHSRVPVFAPERITEDLVAALAASGKTLVLAAHVNHARELTTEALGALRRLASAGVLLLSQTVLLKGVNADAATLEALFRALIAAGVKPYYLHHMDLAPGTRRFRTTLAEGERLMAELARRLTGIARPAYVIDIPGGYGKIVVGADTVLRDPATGKVTLIDREGRRHGYSEIA